MDAQQKAQTRRHRQRGNAGVEAALVILPFLMMILGIVNLGVAFFLNDMLLDRVRAASRYAALNPDNISGIKNKVLFGSATDPNSTPQDPYSSPTQTDSANLDANGEEIMPVTQEPFLGLSPEKITVSRLFIGTDGERIVVTVRDYELPFFVPGFVKTIVGSPVVAAAAVEKQ